MPTLPKSPRLGLLWQLIEHHYAVRNLFLAIYKTYEARVARLVEERGLPRDKLRLNPAETKDLFDTYRLRMLISEHVEPLREVSHELFRNDEVSDLYDSKASRIYHELSVLNEEHLSVRNFPPDGPAREFSRLFQEVSEYYPQRLRRVRDLLARAQHRLDDLLPQFRDDPIVLRSAFLFRKQLWPEHTRAGLTRFLAKMFPNRGAPHGFLKIAGSFHKAGFHAQAVEGAKMGIAVASSQEKSRKTPAKEHKETVRKLDRLLARAETEMKALADLESAS